MPTTRLQNTAPSVGIRSGGPYVTDITVDYDEATVAYDESTVAYDKTGTPAVEMYAMTLGGIRNTRVNVGIENTLPTAHVRNTILHTRLE